MPPRLPLAEINREVGPGAHAVLILDGAGWHRTADLLRLPASISLLHLPPCAPELNPGESLRAFLQGDELSSRLFGTYGAIVAAPPAMPRIGP